MVKNEVLIKKYRAPIYRTPLWIIVSDNLIKAIDTVEDLIDHRIIDQNHKKSTDAYTYAYADHEGSTKVMIFIHYKAKPGRIAHEANHAVNIILSWNGVKPSFTNDESECYFLDHIVDRTHDTIKLYNKSI